MLDLELLSLFPSALSTVLAEGNGFLALNYPHMGTMPFPGFEEYVDDY